MTSNLARFRRSAPAAALAFLMICLGTGCSPAPAEKQAATKPAASKKKAKRKPGGGGSVTEDIIHTMTGRHAVDSGLKARDVIKETSAQKKADLEEAYKIGGGQ